MNMLGEQGNHGEKIWTMGEKIIAGGGWTVWVDRMGGGRLSRVGRKRL